MDKLTILIDENIATFDNKVRRISYCAVEIPEESVEAELNNIIAEIKSDTIRFGNINKMHFSELSEAQRSAVIDKISKISVTAKVFVYYYFGGKEKEQKIESVKKVIKNIRHIHKGKDIVIQLEYADEYKEKELMPLLIKNNPLFIVPDGYLAVFIGKLNNISGNIGSYDRMYTLIREKIRLQVFEWGEEKMYLTSNDRL